MTKKMKGVVLDSSPYGVYEDVKTRFKHQTLIQDYQDLQKEAKATINKLDTMKQRKVTLLAEVRFLRRRYKFLLKNKSPNTPQERELVQQKNVEPQRKSKSKVRMYSKKGATLGNLPSSFNLNQKVRVLMGKETALQNATPNFDLNHKETWQSGKEAALHNPTHASDLNQRGRIHRVKKAAFQNPMPVIDPNQKEKIYGGNDAALRNPAPVFYLNQKEITHNRKEADLQARTPIFDLNQISTEEEEFQENCEPLRFEEAKRALSKGGSDERPNDLKLSVCRNVGDGSSRAGKRKISWQDPVALRV